ncbi:MAG: endonuclease/exonuclease/phosphatase family protein [Bacteroidales bacterium]|nr:endonuclease/exonuclease/phosphatase family protein [Bacteroidales bacterium]
MQFFRSSFLIIGLFCIICLSPFKSTYAQDTLEVMYYNILNYPGSTPERVNYFKTINQYVRADIILVNEILSESGADILLQDGLNVYGSNHYNKVIFTDGYDTDNMLFYNSEKLVLYSQDTIETALRLINEYVLYYKTDMYFPIDDTTFFHFYSAHLKASTGTTNQQKRLAEVLEFKDHIDNKSNVENIFFGGDFNVYSSSEPAYQSLINDGQFPLNDPLPAGSWHDNENYAMIHSQSTRTAQFGGGATGGMDDRFDFILFSEDVNTGNNGVSYIPNSCYALGNDGYHFNGSLIDSPQNTSVPDSVIQALYYMADHLPVLCKIEVQLPEAQQDKYLDLKVYLEGAYNGPNMNTGLNSILPENQPYNQPPWNYTGVELNSGFSGSSVVDWILLELRETTGEANMATPDTKIWEQACLLLNDGTIIKAGGSTFPKIDIEVNNNLFVIIRHRNHLDIMSANPLILTDSLYSYDYSISQDQILGFTQGYKEISPGIWGMVSGDANGDGLINQLDKVIWINQAGNNGYLPADFNMDSQIDNLDKNVYWFLNQNYYSTIPE